MMGNSMELRQEIKLLCLIFALSLIPFLLVWASGRGVGVQGDGVGYYAYLRSMFFDHDLNFENEYVYYAQRGQKVASIMLAYPMTDTGLVGNHWAVGTPLLWTPFFLLGHVVASVLNALGQPVSIDGYSTPYIALISLGTAFYAFIGLLLSYIICRKLFGRQESFLALIMTWFATALTAYMYFHTTLSHPASFFLVALFLYLWFNSREERRLGTWIIMGFVGGIMLTGRWQNLLFFIPLLLDSALKLLRLIKLKTQIGRFIGHHIVFSISVLVGFLPQMLAWKVIYGNFLSDPFAGNPNRWHWATPQIFNVMFSSKHGLLSWTPVVAFALIGLFFLLRKDKLLGGSFLAVFLAQLYLVASWHSWYAGSSFSNRYFIECTPIFVIGLATFISRLKAVVPFKLIIAFGFAFILWNLAFIIQFGLGLIPREDYFPWSLMLYNQFYVVPKIVFEKAGQVLGRNMAFTTLLAILVIASIGSLPFLWKKIMAVKGRGE